MTVFVSVMKTEQVLLSSLVSGQNTIGVAAVTITMKTELLVVCLVIIIFKMNIVIVTCVVIISIFIKREGWEGVGERGGGRSSCCH